MRVEKGEIERVRADLNSRRRRSQVSDSHRRKRNQVSDSRRQDGRKRSSAGPLWLKMLERHMPDFLRKAEIRILMQMTAAACQTAGSVWGRTSRDHLAAYRQFTVDIMAGRSRKELLRYRRAMYMRAYRVGRLLSLLPGLRDEERKKRLIVLLYRNIEIEILYKHVSDAAGNMSERVSESGGSTAAENENRSESENEFIWQMHIPRCFFSALYTPKICYVMSGFDAGIICGVFGGGTLRFSRRLTERCPACRARFELGAR